jgi:membrane protein
MTPRAAATRLRELGAVGTAMLARLEDSVAGRFLQEFVALRAIDRALALASKLFIAVLPLSILSTTIVSGRAYSDQIVERFGLTGAGARAARSLFAAPAQVETGIGLLGVVILASSVMSFAQALERTYLDCWTLPPAGATALRDRLSWLAALVVTLAVGSGLRAALSSLHAEAAIWLVAAVIVALFFLWTPYILLGRRVSRHRLVPTAVLSGAGALVLGIGSAIVMPGLVSRNTDRYGLIGFTFSLVSWLFAAALLVISAAILGALLDPDRRGARAALPAPAGDAP